MYFSSFWVHVHFCSQWSRCWLFHRLPRLVWATLIIIATKREVWCWTKLSGQVAVHSSSIHCWTILSRASNKSDNLCPRLKISMRVAIFGGHQLNWPKTETPPGLCCGMDALNMIADAEYYKSSKKTTKNGETRKSACQSLRACTVPSVNVPFRIPWSKATDQHHLLLCVPVTINNHGKLKNISLRRLPRRKERFELRSSIRNHKIASTSLFPHHHHLHYLSCPHHKQQILTLLNQMLLKIV